jgi:hypothetical protein
LVIKTLDPDQVHFENAGSGSEYNESGSATLLKIIGIHVSKLINDSTITTIVE